MKRYAVLLLLAACAGQTPPPRVLGEAAEVRSSPAASQAQKLAPQAYAHAAELERRANAQHAAGDVAGAQILGEQAIAAYEHAVVLARISATVTREAEATGRVARAEAELSSLAAQERTVRAETEDMELRTRVVTEALPVVEAGPATPEREKARVEAVRASLLQARLLCVAARLLEPERAKLPELFRELDELASKPPKPAPMDSALRLRSRCLAELSQARRPKSLASPSDSQEDQLLSELSSASYQPARDERGVVVTLRGLFDKSALAAATTPKLQALARVAAQHPTFPVLVVLHTAGNSDNQDQARLELVASALKAGGATKVEQAFGGNAAPLVEPKRERAASMNERVEIVFVSPTS